MKTSYRKLCVLTAVICGAWFVLRAEDGWTVSSDIDEPPSAHTGIAMVTLHATTQYEAERVATLLETAVLRMEYLEFLSRNTPDGDAIKSQRAEMREEAARWREIATRIGQSVTPVK